MAARRKTGKRAFSVPFIVFTQHIAMTIDDSMPLYNRIALFRAERGLSRRALADAVGVNPQTIGYLERGDYAPSLELGMRIAAEFDVPVEFVFSFTPFAPVADALRRAGDA